jgi:hypothetical protein
LIVGHQSNKCKDYFQLSFCNLLIDRFSLAGVE